MKKILPKEDYEEPLCILDMKNNHPVKMKDFINQFLCRLDDYYQKKDYEKIEQILLSSLNEAKVNQLDSFYLVIINELMGFYRLQKKKQEAFFYVQEAASFISNKEELNITEKGTTYLNMATVYKAFNQANEALGYYQLAQTIYEKNLAETDLKLAGLYNNMGLALVDVNNFNLALILYQKALRILNLNKPRHLNMAITYLNLANLYEKKLGPLNSASLIDHLLTKASKVLDDNQNDNDGYYAFVCEKCAPTFSYYGYFNYAKKLNERAKNIYERT